MGKSLHFPAACFRRGGYLAGPELAALQFWDSSTYVYEEVDEILWLKHRALLNCEGCWFNELWRFNPAQAFARSATWPDGTRHGFLWLQHEKRYILLPDPSHTA